MGEVIGDTTGREKDIPFAGGVRGAQTRQPGVEVNGPQHPVQSVFLRVKEQSPGCSYGGETCLAGEGQGAVHLVSR